jgi:nitrilase
VNLRVAAIQDCPVLPDREATFDLVDELTERAAREGAQLVAFPEAFVPGPPVWVDALRVSGDAEWYALLRGEGVMVPGSGCDRFAEAARSAGVVLAVGVNARERHGGTIYNSVLTFGSDGSLLGCHRKLMPTQGERLVWGMGDGSDLRVFGTPVGRLASLICWENYMPLARFQLFAQSPQIWLDLDTLGARKRLFDAAGRYNRPDVFRLEVDDRPKPPVVTRSRMTRATPSSARRRRFTKAVRMI